MFDLGCTLQTVHFPRQVLWEKPKQIITHHRAQSSCLYLKGKAALDVNSRRMCSCTTLVSKQTGDLPSHMGTTMNNISLLHCYCQCKNTAHLPHCSFSDSQVSKHHTSVWKSESLEKSISGSTSCSCSPDTHLGLSTALYWSLLPE